MLPLPEPEHAPSAISAEGNRGLWFERFFNQFNDDASAILKPSREQPNQGNNFWLHHHFKTAGNKDALQLAAKQQLALIASLKGTHRFFNTQWHFVTGMGYPHPVENGLLWHKTYGVPYLSGAAVKGLVRAWVEQWAEFDTEEEREKCLLSWFGSDHKIPKQRNHPVSTGDIIFFDALPVKDVLPVKEVSLATDIMTPHYGKWYAEGGTITNVATQPEKIPADWHDPNPISFLAVDKDTSFLFSIAPSPRMLARDTKETIEKTLTEIIEYLDDALDWLGAGAKTATGYGQMISEEHKEQEQIKQAIDWLNEAIEALKNDKDFKGQSEENLWKKALSEKWLRASPELQKPILELIKKKWKDLDISWDQPKGKSAEEAKRNFTK